MASEFPKLKSGDELTPWHLNIVYRELDRWRRLKFAGAVAYSGIDSASSPPVVTILGSGPRGRLAYTTTAISPRSGTTPGSGTVQLKSLVAGAIANDGGTLTAYTASADTTAGGHNIDSGKYCWVEWDPSGTPWVAPLEC